MKRARTIQTNTTAAELSSAVPPVEALPRPSRVHLSFQQRLWFLLRLAGGSEACHIQIGLQLRGEADEAVLRPALDGLEARHEVLRSTFGLEDGEPFQRVRPTDAGLRLKRDDLRAAADVEVVLKALMSHETQHVVFDLEAGPLIRGWLLRVAMYDHVPLITMHHMVSDRWSRKVLVRELSELYAAAREGRADRLARLVVQYTDHAFWRRRWLTGQVVESQAEYWLRILGPAPAALTLPPNWPRPAQQEFSGRYFEFVLHEPLTTQLKALSRFHGTTLFVALLAGWALMLARPSGQDELVIGTSTTSRMRSESEGLIGFFGNTLALRMDLSGDPTLETLLQRVDATALGG
ncbi:non-ribosomal peptide synthetase, partial [Mesorhizobium sp. M2A.F.Ca.ET.042.01.1.1]|uniref:condensation domain-containing protein n=1 Tax=Mesorhizobium sp. M2A.F.Ca.ET.042.01.1.1 TaxID=2496745 RepID=UPI000FD3D958